MFYCAQRYACELWSTCYSVDQHVVTLLSRAFASVLMTTSYKQPQAAGGGLGWGAKPQGVWGRESLSGVQGRSPGRGSGGRSPPEAEEF